MTENEVRAALGQFPVLSSLLSEEQITRVLQAPSTYRNHPFRELFLEATGHSSSMQVLTNTEQGVRTLLSSKPDVRGWVARRIDEATQQGDLNNAAAALGELRAAGALCEAGFDVTPNPVAKSPRSDFHVAVAQHTVTVEVATKQMNQAEAQQLRQQMALNEVARKKASRTGVYVSEPMVIRPGGTPTNPGETIGENVGHKFASIKPAARQASLNEPSLLWVDVQDEDWWATSEQHARPVTTWNGEFTSGGIWHGFYGTPGVSTLECQAVEERATEVTYRQSYPGLFAQTKRWSGAILSFPRSTILFEHPSPQVRLGDALIERMLSLPWFQFENSWLEWPQGVSSVADRVQRAVAELNSLATRAKYRW